MTKKTAVACLVVATMVVFSTGCDIPGDTRNGDEVIITDPADTASAGEAETQDTDTELLSKRAKLCLEEVEVDIQPQKAKTLLLWDRSDMMLNSTGFAPVIAGEFLQLLHKTEEWIDPALMVYPGTICESILEEDHGIRGSTIGSLLVSFGESDPVQEINYQLGGWFGVGHCGVPVLTSTLFNAIDYLDLEAIAPPVEVVVFTTGSNLSDYEVDPANCACSIDPSHTDTDDTPCVDYPMMCYDLHGAAVPAQQMHEAGHRVHFAFFSKWPWDQAYADEWAAAGGTGSSVGAYDAVEVNQAVWKVGKKLLSCHLGIDFRKTGSHATSISTDKVNLFLNDQLLVFDETCQGGVGWHWVDDETIGLCPNSCTDLKEHIAATTFEYSATYGCDSRLEVGQ